MPHQSLLVRNDYEQKNNYQILQTLQATHTKRPHLIFIANLPNT